MNLAEKFRLKKSIPFFTKFISDFDSLSQRIGKHEGFRRGYWWYLTQDRYFSGGMSKIFIPMQFIALLTNVGILLLLVEKFVSIPLWFYSLTPLLVILFAVSCNILGRFIDKSELLDLEAEWGRQRDPLSQELRKKWKLKGKFEKLKR